MQSHNYSMLKVEAFPIDVQLFFFPPGNSWSIELWLFQMEASSYFLFSALSLYVWEMCLQRCLLLSPLHITVRGASSSFATFLTISIPLLGTYVSYLLSQSIPARTKMWVLVMLRWMLISEPGQVPAGRKISGFLPSFCVSHLYCKVSKGNELFQKKSPKKIFGVSLLWVRLCDPGLLWGF